MLATDLYTIPVNQLQLGMTIHGIAEQAGKLTVKKKGKVAHLTLIDQLSAHGVVSVVIEKAKLPTANVLQKLSKQKQLIQTSKSLVSEAESGSIFADFESTEISLEMKFAGQLLKRSHEIHKKFSDKIRQSIAVDLSEVKDIALNIYGSLSRHPSALLSLSMLMTANNYLAKHAIHSAILMCYFAKHLGMQQADCERLALLGYVYDMGMLKIPKHIMDKNAALNDEEKTAMQAHVLYSLDIVAPLQLDNDLNMAIEQHHERLHGNGYPNRVSGATIHKFSRMLAIVDCYNALTNQRAYKQGDTPTHALKHLSKVENGYDPKLVLRFIRAMGVYPVGSLVLLSNKRVAVVIKNHTVEAAKPVVKVFYSLSAKAYITPQTINLATPHNELTINKPILAEQYGLDIDKSLFLK